MALGWAQRLGWCLGVAFGGVGSPQDRVAAVHAGGKLRIHPSVCDVCGLLRDVGIFLCLVSADLTALYRVPVQVTAVLLLNLYVCPKLRSVLPPMLCGPSCSSSENVQCFQPSQ